jgi:hypothetical protein
MRSSPARPAGSRENDRVRLRLALSRLTYLTSSLVLRDATARSIPHGSERTLPHCGLLI